MSILLQFSSKKPLVQAKIDSHTSDAFLFAPVHQFHLICMINIPNQLIVGNGSGIHQDYKITSWQKYWQHNRNYNSLARLFFIMTMALRNMRISTSLCEHKNDHSQA